MARVSIHLVTWNGQKYIEECLNSILEQTYDDYFLMVIDNSSYDETIEIIEKQFLPVFGSKIRFIKNKENLGFARAHNQALLWTDSDYVLVLNQDVILENDYLEEAVAFLDKNKAVGALTGKILKWQFKEVGDLKKSKKSTIIDSLGLKIFKNQRVIERCSEEKDIGQYDKNEEIFGVSAACPFYRRKALQDIRYEDEFFDNDFFSYKEDVDIAWRLRWRAWSSWYIYKAKAYHDRTAQTKEKTTFSELFKARKNKVRFINYHSYKNHFFVLLKNLSKKNFYRYFLHIGFYEFKKIIYLLIFERSTLFSLKLFFSKKKLMKKKRKFIMNNKFVQEDKMRKWFN